MLSAGVAAIRDRLPSTWSLSTGGRETSDRGADAVLSIRAPDGTKAVLIVEAKRLLETRDVATIREQLANLTARQPGSVGVVVAQYLSKSTRERLAEAGLSFADATGNILVRAEAPGLFISDRGADNDPWRGPGRPRGTLKGEPAAKVVRALLDLKGPWKIRDLVGVSKASTGSVYRVLEFLESEALATREDGLISVPDWSALLRRWSEDYQFLHTNTITRWIAPRGLAAFLERVRDSDVGSYALTGSVAAAAWQSYAPARSAMVYISEAERAAMEWGLRPTETGANVLIAKPAYPVVLERTVTALEGLQVAAPTQVAADLMTGPGRAPSEAEELLDWMERNEQSWR
ncbi:hypothetical protein SPF06_12970 [Sinomonas sp. JGH33]|uniref:HTH iclR-type domain-containing protein n=1 Tax=Sinomonas terricola TaxID=3110330 RepID=A0ABU5T7I5_9MICC|nr:hypothetical protein [Sinomonas sp. JGH33]MEA5455638.1 hypothetical protein [Sinomonas sp. JGH33]